MAYNYNEDVYNTSTDVKTLQQRIENNFDALIHCFSGTSSPGVSYTGQWWYDTSSNIMKFRSGSGWVEVFDVGAGTAIVGTGAIGSDQISGSARKGTLVEGQAIAPSSCTLKAKPIVNSMPGMFSTEPALSKVGVGSLVLMSQIVYIPLEVQTLYMLARARKVGSSTVTLRFYVGSQSSNSDNLSTSYSWTDELSAGVSSITGWNNVMIEAYVLGTSTEVNLQGFSFRSNE